MAKVTIKADIMWAQLNKKNEMSGKYQVDLVNLSDAAVHALEAEGMEPRFSEEKQSFITCKSTRPIFAKGQDGESLNDINIGNGSKCVAVIGSYEWKFKGKEGVSPSLDQLIITHLEVYETDDVDEATLDEAL